MLMLSAALLNKPVVSLRTGEVIATVTSPIFNPNNLKIEGFYCLDRFSKNYLVLLNQDVREFTPRGYVVNDHDVLSEPRELVKLKEILEINFELVGKPIETTSKEKVGKVSDYATEVDTMYVQKLYAARSILKDFTGGSLSIDRTQIVETTPKRIIIHDLANAKRSPAAIPA